MNQFNNLYMIMFSPKEKEMAGGSLPSRYQSQKRRDWHTFREFLKGQRPPVALPQCNGSHVIEFFRYLDKFGKTKVHLHGCLYYGQPDPPGPCTCPLRQAWGSLDALVGRLRAAYEESGGSPETSPFASEVIRVYLRERRECQAMARGIPFRKKRKGEHQSSRLGLGIMDDPTSTTMHFS